MLKRRDRSDLDFEMHGIQKNVSFAKLMYATGSEWCLILGGKGKSGDTPIGLMVLWGTKMAIIIKRDLGCGYWLWLSASNIQE